ncbi:MAG: DHH family phosphoesterase [archaeon]|nr:DHH family phosphoesterase [archaeon]MCR4323647.1 DHH family phosphoesterase [Nanoarchaeota archaeon]
MISLTELREIRVLLENSQNPLFFFDNDVDGLCAFLILRRAIGRGRGIAIKSFPDLREQYLKKIDELNPDAIFVLDKAEVSEAFLEGVIERNLPITWIDHHESKTEDILREKTNYFNSMPSAEPTTFIAHNVFNRKEDMWLAMIGCIGDSYMPDFAEDFEKTAPELFNSKVSSLEALHSTEIGKMVRMLNFGLMDTTTNVVSLIKFLFKANNSYDLLEENRSTKQFHQRYAELNEIFIKQVNKAEEDYDGKSGVLFHSYSGNVSMSSEIANRLYFNHQDKLVVVVFKRPEKINVSLRGKNALKITLRVTKEIEGATGGGHEVATGAMIPIDEFENFKKKILEAVNG